MGLRLAVERDAWQRHVDRAARSRPGLTPVIKGNGYGFGRATLVPFAVALTGRAGQIAVGTVYEASTVPAERTALVLTPHVDRLPADLPDGSVLTVGSVHHVRALAAQGHAGAVAVKLASSMHRYGCTADQLPSLLDEIHGAGCTVDSTSIHLPLVGSDDDHVAEIVGWLEDVQRQGHTWPMSVSHISPAAYAALRAAHPDVAWRYRAGTALWHADKALLHLTADVLEVRPVQVGQAVGYRGAALPSNGHLVLVAAGSAHGVCALDDGRSPFHHARRRMALIEPPHMHTSMLFIPHGDPLPNVGERVDVQRPLTMTAVDELRWLP